MNSHEQMKADFRTFAERLPKIAESDQAGTIQALAAEPSLAEELVQLVLQRNKAEVWTAVSILICFLVQADKAQQQELAERVN